MNNIPRPEHPNPQMMRKDWLNLNGEWEFEFDHSSSGKARELHKADSLKGRITVPFCFESDLSGIGYKDFVNCVWYRKEVKLPENWMAAGERLLLHFGAVDYRATIYVNGQQAGTHKGGYSSFCLDITPYLNGKIKKTKFWTKRPLLSLFYGKTTLFDFETFTVGEADLLESYYKNKKRLLD